MEEFWQTMARGANGRLLVRLDRVAALPAYLSVTVFPQEDPGATFRLRAWNALPDQFPIDDFIFRWLGFLPLLTGSGHQASPSGSASSGSGSGSSVSFSSTFFFCFDSFSFNDLCLSIT